MPRPGELATTLLSVLALAGLALVEATSQTGGFLETLFSSVKEKGASGLHGDLHALCSLEAADGRLNFFAIWPHSPDSFGQQAFAALESILFHHPDANVVVVSPGPAPKHLEVYPIEGYCVAAAYVDLQVTEQLFAAAVSTELAATYIGKAIPVLTDESRYLGLLNSVALALQVLYGGVSLLLDGLLLNPFGFMLPRQLHFSRTAVFFEQLMPAEEPASATALQAEDFELSWLPRSHTDRADGRTLLCTDLVCPRALPARCVLGESMLKAWLQDTLSAAGGPGSNLNQFATTLYRSYVRSRQHALTAEAQRSTFDHEIVVLPYWAIVEPHFPDGWKAYGGRDDLMTKHTQLFAPRPRREPTDWSLVSSTKLWMPLTYGPPSARNILPRSVVDLAMRRFTLSIMPVPYRTKSFGAQAKLRTRLLRSPKDVQMEFDAGITKAAKNEAALPGAIGGFRTFRNVRLVGRDTTASGAAAPWRMTLSVRKPVLELFCRPEPRPTKDTHGHESAAFRACKAGLRPVPIPSEPSSADTWTVLFDACGRPGELNAAVALLAYTPVRTPSKTLRETREKAAGLDLRHTAAELSDHFGEMQVVAAPTCKASEEGGPQSLSVELAALLDKAEDHVTVVAHCAERCHLLERLALSFREAYAELPVLTTCECAENEHCPEPVPRPHPSIAHMTVVSVPYDFGLSRGKSLLAKMVQTEFVLVLDDDFVHSYHSCLECMLWRMRSRYHSLWRPFDILGFPVLEDERIFGAFRGQLRVASHQLFLEPMAEQITPDGCMRVDICPMVFLARTERFQAFRFSENLRVGEHEKFFFSNAYFGMQVAVCFDSSFPHFRVNTMSAAYVKRRERMPELMQAAFKKLGFERAMFLFRKYDHGDADDHDELLDKAVPPWFISDDTCGQRPSPPIPFAQVFVLVLSTADAIGERYRRVLRGSTDAASVWLQRFAELGRGVTRWIFGVAAGEDPSMPESLMRERDEHQDIVVLSHGPRPTAALAEFSAEQLLHIFALLRDFQFRWLLVVRQEVHVQFERLLTVLQQQEPPQHKVLGSWRIAGVSGEPALVGAASTASTAAAAVEAAAANEGSWRLQPHLFAVSRDVFSLLSAPVLNSRLAAAGHDLTFGDLGTLAGGLNTWLRALTVQRVALPGMHLEQRSLSASDDLVCPPGALALHPVSPELLFRLSRDPSAAC